MNIVDLLVTIIVVTILVTIVLAVMTYVAYKLRLARRPAVSDEAPRSRYFEVHEAPEVPDWDIEAEQGAREGGSPSSMSTPSEVSAEAPAEAPADTLAARLGKVAEVDSLDRVS